MERRLEAPIGRVEKMTGAWAPGLFSAPPPRSSPASTRREGTPTLRMIDSGSSMRYVMACREGARVRST